MASGHVNRAKGRTHGRTDQCCRREEIPCQLGAVHTWPISDLLRCPLFGCYQGQSRHHTDMAEGPALDPYRTFKS